MPKQIQLWRVTGDRLDALSESQLNLERRLETWLHSDITVLGETLLVIGRQVATEHGGYIDLLCLDAEGDLVIVELKRDRTPREVTAQLLDYASWAVDLSAERVATIALEALRPESLESAFQRVFREELPEVLNQNHKLLLVGSTIDPASERIIRYLSEHHGVSVNAVTFQYFHLPSGEELLGRVHLLEPEGVDENTRNKGTSKRRKARLSLAELEAAADEHGAGELYRGALEIFQSVFASWQTTRSSIRFTAELDDKSSAVLNLMPTTASPGKLPFQIYTHRAATLTSRPVDDIIAALPADSTDWEYVKGTHDTWWKGHAGSFTRTSECERLAIALRRLTDHP